MYRQEAREEYLQALRLGQRELKTLTAAGKNAYPEVLDELLKDMKTETVVEVGLVEIPMDQVVGIRSAGRTKAFTAGFRPLLPIDTEFAAKWINLCAAHLSEGIREPVLCYEYLGRFYLQEGNKRFSVLKHMGSPRITGQVLRVMPVNDGSPRYQAYKEFLEFYKSTGIYEVQFRRPGDYAELMTHLDKEPGKVWTEREKRNFSAYFHYFCDAFFGHGEELDLLPEEALLLWLRLYPFKDLGGLSTMELKKTVDAMWPDFKAMASFVQALAVGFVMEWVTPSICTRMFQDPEGSLRGSGNFIFYLAFPGQIWYHKKTECPYSDVYGGFLYCL